MASGERRVATAVMASGKRRIADCERRIAKNIRHSIFAIRPLLLFAFRYSLFAIGFLLVLIQLPGTVIVEAGGPLLMTRNGEPFRWRLNPVPYTPDQGPLGQFDHPQAVQLLADAFQVWEAVETATIRFEQRGQLSVDVTGANVMEFLNQVPREVNPFIFDHDGSIMEALVGAGASRDIVGFASPALRQPGTARGDYRQGWAVFNGLFAGSRIPVDAFRGNLVHEIGHFIGLDHTQLNVDRALAGSAWQSQEVPTMFPFLVSRHQARLHLDDIAIVSFIYSEPSFAQSTGTIQGRVLMPNGVAGFQGANVIARRVGKSPVEVSAISGDLFTGNRRGPGGDGSTNPTQRGVFRLVGLPPGVYSVRVEEIHPMFTGGSGLGPLDPPARLVSEPEFYSGAHESNHEALNRIARVPVDAGAVVENVDIILNGRPPANDLCQNATTIGDLSFTDAVHTRLAAIEDGDPPHSCTLRTDSNSVWYTFTPESSGVVVIDTVGSDYDTVLSAYAGTCDRGSEVACNDNIGPPELQSQVVFGVIGGRSYLVEVTDVDNQVGGGELNFSYRFEPDALMQEQEPNEQLSQAQELRRPAAIIGDVGPGDVGIVMVSLPGRVERLEDLYTFTVNQSGQAQINLSIERFGVDVELVLFQSDGSTVTVLGTASSSGLSASLGPTELVPGTYYIGLSVNDRGSRGNPTTYILAIR